MTLDEYPWSVYPPYVAGGSYLLSSDLLPRILMISPHVKHIKLEDVYILNVIGVEPQQNHRYTQIPVCKRRRIKRISNCYWQMAYTVLCGRELDIFWKQRQSLGVLKNYCYSKNITSDTTLRYRV